MLRPLLLGLIALALASASVASPNGRAEAQEPVDLTGLWDVDVRGDFPLDCSAQFQQAGEDVTMALSCGLMDIAFSGTIDLETRAFDVSGSVLFVTIESSGTISEDGERLTGTWSAPDASLNGTFVATRSSEPSAALDLAGDWVLHYVLGSFATCRATLVQDEGDLTGTLECGDRSSALAGSVEGRNVSLSASSEGLNGELAARLDASGRSFSGEWLGDDAHGSQVLAVRTVSDAGSFDLTGGWTTSIGGVFPLTCESLMEQAASELTVVADCSVLSSNLVGPVDESTRTFVATDGRSPPTVVVAAVDGDRGLVGAYYVDFFDGLMGSLTSTRNGRQPLDISGEWAFRFDGAYAVDCQATIDQTTGPLQRSSPIAVELDCGVAGRLEGFADALGRSVTMRGSIGRLDFSLRSGILVDDGSAFQGVWFIEHDLPRDATAEQQRRAFADFGCFAIVRVPVEGELECDPPRFHPNVQTHADPSSPRPTPIRRPLDLVGSSDAGTANSIGGLIGLAAGLVVLGAWRLRMRA